MTEDIASEATPAVEAAPAAPASTKRWYVVHAYSGMEKAVERNILERVKRAGMEGKFGRILVPTEEVVEIKNGQVYVDGVRLAEPYLPSETPGNQRWVVGPLQTFVMGDNRSASKDSRTFGPVQLSHIVGHALFSYWPLNQLGNLE